MFRRRRPAPPPEEPRHGRRRGCRRPRRSPWLYALALIGLLAVLFVLARFLIIPLLVMLA